MKKCIGSFIIILVFVSTAQAQKTKLFIQNTSPQIQLAEELVLNVEEIVEAREDFELAGDKFEKSIQVYIGATHAYKNIFAVAVTVTVFNGDCFCYYNSYVIPTNEKQIINESSNIYLYLLKHQDELKLLME